MQKREESRQRSYRNIALIASIAIHVLILGFLIFGTGGGDESIAQEMTNWVSGTGGEQPPQP